MNERGSIGNPFAKPRIGTLEDLRKSWDERGIDNYAYEKNGAIFLSEIRIPKNNRGKGLGTKAMQELIDYADRTGQKILLTPSIDFGATSVSRLEKFYKQFGFTSNKGSKKDYRYRETMIRRPEVGTKAVSGLLRHKNLRTTEIYLHSIDESQRSAMDGLEGKFAPKKTNPLPAAATKNEKEVTDIP